MNAFRLLGMELSQWKEKKGLLFSLIGVLLIPIVYAAIMLSATWGPYDNLSNLPVAVVNKDQGATSGDQPINVGKDLVEELKSSNTLGWDFVSDEEAKKGLENQKYYMVIEIPEDFSKKVTTVLDAKPQVPQLKYIQNEGLNFMAAQVTRSATERIREQLGNKITKTYTSNLFSKFGDISEGFQSGADGSQKLFEGTSKLEEGTSTLLTGLTEKSADINKLAAGSKELAAGTQKLYNSLTSKQGDISKLANGAKKVDDGTTQLLQALQNGSGDINKLAAGSKKVADGAKALNTGSTKVLDGLKKAQAGSKELNAGLDKLVPGSAGLAAGMSQIEAGTKGLSDATKGLSAGLEAYLGKHPELKNDMEFMTLVGTSQVVSKKMQELSAGVVPLKAGAEQIAGGLAQAAPGVKDLDNGLSQLVAGQTMAVKGIGELSAGADQIAAGNSSLATSWTKMTNSVAQLQQGVSQISAGNQTVASGWKSLSSGAGQLHSGMQKVSAGNESVKNGWSAMSEGVSKLNNGAQQLKDGSKKLSEGLSGGANEIAKVKVSDENIEMFSSPVELAGEKVNELQYYRDSSAPYILSLALFVGILILSFVTDFKKPLDVPNSAFSWFFSKFLKLSIFAVAQALLVSVFTLVVLGLQVESVFSFVLFSVFVSLTFLTIVFFLVALGGNIGRFVALAFIVMQLSTTGSNLPIPMLPENLQTLSKYLPLTYSNAGFKSIISLGDSSFLWSNTSILGIYFGLFAVLSLAVFFFSFKKQDVDMTLAA
ncbi:YhgE/Pip family protein [Peribacillus tepidiphilus]|uniref:YhgE/Pip family protein n=1 Tax=Peribacillus tepidiphilus TaxID=2652445 RepID=UPI0035B50DEC